MTASRSIERILTSQVKLRQLLVLEVVAEYGAVSRAAEHLHISQPAVSKTIRELEDALGEPLFERGAKGVTPTPFGSHVIRYAKSMHAELRRTAEELAALREGGRRQLSMGSYMVALPSLLPRALSIYLDSGGTARVSVVTGSKEDLLRGLRDGNMEIVVGRMAEPASNGDIRQIPLYFEPIVLVAGAHNKLARQPELAARDLEQQEWILPPPDSVARTPILMFLAREGLALPSRAVETLAYPLIRSLLMQRNMVGVLPWQIVQADIEQGHLVRLPLDIGYPALPVGIITNAQVELSPAGRHMIECLRQAAGQLQYAMTSP